MHGAWLAAALAGWPGGRAGSGRPGGSGGVSTAPWDDGGGGGGLNLGRHVDDAVAAVEENRVRLRALLPGAEQVTVIDAASGNPATDIAENRSATTLTRRRPK